jgi:hypothetical protein
MVRLKITSARTPAIPGDLASFFIFWPFMNRKTVFTGLKVIVIIVLVMGISLLVMIQWKSDVIIDKAVTLLQDQLEDSLRYEEISLEWFRFFPSVAIELDQLYLGKHAHPFLEDGNVAIALKLLPLFNEKVVINRLVISNSKLHLRKHNGQWTYDLFKKKEVPKVDAADVQLVKEGSAWEALVKQLELQNTFIYYDDQEGKSLSLDVDRGILKGNLSGDLLDSDIEMTATLHDLRLSSYHQTQPFPFELTGTYIYDVVKGFQEMKNWELQSEGMAMELRGIIRKEENGQWTDIHAAWNDADPQSLKSLIPAPDIRQWHQYRFSGKSEGQINIKGVSGKDSSPRITFSSELRNGSIIFPGKGGQLKNVLLALAYDSGEGKAAKASYFRANLRNGSFESNSFKANMRMENLDAPVVSADLNGSMPASMMNIFMDSVAWNFREGLLDFEDYHIKSLNAKTISTKTLIEKSSGGLRCDKVVFSYHGDEMRIEDGKMNLDDNGMMKLSMDEFVWNKARGKGVEGQLQFAGDRVDFEVTGEHSQGKVKAKGNVQALGTKPIMTSDWTVKGIEIKELLTSFDNFDQIFITSEHLKGKTDIWAQTIIPYDDQTTIIADKVNVKAALHIRDGQLKDLRTLEDFSQYVHLDDLRDIRFNELKNYLKIEDGKVYLPVMFLQSSAINMSINGVHSFNHQILYNLKINAGQAAANKLKKFDPLRKIKQARKSGWINLYFVLSGTVDNVRYEQDQNQVVSSFEQSTRIKEDLRNFLVDRFGHDVYWIEPNEWEDIPEYK